MGIGKLIGGIIGGESAKSASKKAVAAQVEVANLNNQLARDFKAENVAYNAPYANRGNIAGAYINALLGLPGAEYTTQVPPMSNAPQRSNPYGIGQAVGGGFGGGFPGVQMSQAPQNSMVTTRVNPVTAQKAFNTYQDSTGYQFRKNEGMNALNQGYAAQGSLRSGAAMKDFMRYGQGIASDEFGRYLGYLGGQQATGLGGAGAIAGIGTTALNAMTQNNRGAADARSDGYLYRGNINAGNWKAAGGVLDNFASSFMGGM